MSRRGGGARLRSGPQRTGGGSNLLAPRNVVAPVISGTAYVGATLTSTTGTWSGVPAPTFTYQWKRDGVNISAATASTYATVLADAGTDVTCTVTATNAAGTASANSNAIEPWHPTLLGLYAAYEADAYTLGTGSEVHIITDLSGNANHLTAVGANGARATVATDSGYNNQPIITAVTGKAGYRVATWAQGSLSQPLSVIWGGEKASTGTAWLYDHGANSGNGSYRYYNNATGWNIGAGGTERQGGVDRAKGVRLDAYALDAGDTDRIFLNDLTTSITAADAGDNALQGMTLFALPEAAATTLPYDGKLAFLYVKANGFSAPEKALLVGYVNWKWTFSASV